MADLLQKAAIRLAETAADRSEAIRQCGQTLVETGAVTPEYTNAMLAREQSVSTFVGEGVAIPHGTLDSREHVLRDALAVLRFREPVDWAGDQVTVCVAIAATGNGHIGLLSALAEILLDPAAARALRNAEQPDQVIKLLASMRREET